MNRPQPIRRSAACQDPAGGRHAACNGDAPTDGQAGPPNRCDCWCHRLPAGYEPVAD